MLLIQLSSLIFLQVKTEMVRIPRKREGDVLLSMIATLRQNKTR
ncbi:hypothetical protein [Paenibacillus illinoisensis]